MNDAVCRVREAKVGDARELIELIRSFPTPTPQRAGNLEATLRRHLDDPAAYVGVADGGDQLLGYVLAYRHATFYAGETAWTDELLVAESARRCGIGRSLMQAVETWAHEHQCALVGLATAGAREFYEHIGYASQAGYYKKYLRGRWIACSGPIRSAVLPIVTVEALSPDHAGAARLLRMSDDYMASLYPAQSNHLESSAALAQANVAFFGAYCDKELVGCGAVKVRYDDGVYGEIKRVFVVAAHRGKGISIKIMDKLEAHLLSLGISVARLETGTRQPEALGLYAKLGYTERPPFGGYPPDPLSIFMERQLAAEDRDGQTS